jgi:hypothetical protein
MRKIRLNPEDLHIDSFSTLAPEEERGTVLGHYRVPPAESGMDPCVVYTNTCGASCYGTCGATCGATCYNTCGNTCGTSCSPLAYCIPPAQ